MIPKETTEEISEDRIQGCPISSHVPVLNVPSQSITVALFK